MSSSTCRIGLAVALASALVLGAFSSSQAALQPSAYLGRIVQIDGGSIVVRTEFKAGGGWEPHSVRLVGSVPHERATRSLCVGDAVQVASLGDPGHVVAVARLNQPVSAPGPPGRSPVEIRAIYGDPGFLVLDPPALDMGMRSLTYETVPDCSQCSGGVCRAAYADVRIRLAGSHPDGVKEMRLRPGQTETLSLDQADERLAITFHDGEAVCTPECCETPPLGPQPVSTFTIELERAESSYDRVADFDANGNGRIDDAEVLTAIDLWIDGTIGDMLFFRLLDAWVKQTEVAERGDALRSLDIPVSFDAMIPGSEASVEHLHGLNRLP